jgi:MYXO-CTERM domain-containing protein
MRAISNILAMALSATVLPALASTTPVTLTFDDTPLMALVGNTYAGSGATFSSNAWSVRSFACDDDGDGFSFVGHNGSCGALMLTADPMVPPGTNTVSFTIDFAGGFSELSFFYSALRDAGVSFAAFSGLGGTGTELDLSVADLTGSSCAISGVRFCDWTENTLQITNGMAMSLVISGVEQRLLLDDLTFAGQETGNELPEPTSVALALGALAAAGWTRRRKSVG